MINIMLLGIGDMIVDAFMNSLDAVTQKALGYIISFLVEHGLSGILLAVRFAASGGKFDPWGLLAELIFLVLDITDVALAERGVKVKWATKIVNSMWDSYKGMLGSLAGVDYGSTSSADILQNTISSVINKLSWRPSNFWTGGLDAAPAFSNPYYLCMKIMKQAIMPTAMTIFALFVIVELFQITLKSEGMRNSGFETPFKLMIKVALCKIFLDNTQMILDAIFNIGCELLDKLKTVMITTDLNLNMDDKFLQEAVDNMLVVPFYIYALVWIQLMIQKTITTAIMLFVSFVLLQRMVEIYLYIVFSPIPFSTFIHQEINQIGKTFCKQLLGLSLRTCVMYVTIIIVTMFALSGSFSAFNLDMMLIGIVVAKDLIILGAYWAAVGVLGVVVLAKPVLYSLFFMNMVMSSEKYTKAFCGAWW